MADKTSIEIKIETAAAANSVKDLRTSLKSLKDELNNVAAGSQEFKKISNAINETEGRLGDLNDSFSTFTGSGVERTTKSFNLLKEGFATFDFGKIKSALGGLTAAFRAVPIFLLVEGITYLISNFKELSEGTGILAKVLKPIGVLIGWIKDSLYELTDAIGLTNSALDEMGEIAVKNAESTQAALANQLTEYDRQIKVAKAAGKNTIDLEIAKQQAIIDTNVAIAKQIEAFVRAGGVLDDEKKKLLTASLNAIKDAKIEEIVIQEKKDKEAHDNWLKIQEEKKKKQEEDDKLTRERVEAQYAFMNDMLGKGLQAMIDNANAKLKYQQDIDKVLMEQEAEKNRKIKEQKTTDLANEDAEIQATLQSREENTFAYKLQKLEEEKQAKLDNAKLTEEERINIIKDSNKQETELKEAQREQNAQIAKQGISAIQGISDLYYASQLKAAKGNAAKEKQIRKEQFNVNKAFGITNAVIDGVRGVQSALAMGPPAGYVFAALSAVMAGINIAKIASAKFDEGGSSGTDANIGSVGSSASGAPPPIANPSNTVDTTKFGEGGKNLEMTPPKAQVVETEITSKQKIVTKMEGQAVF